MSIDHLTPPAVRMPCRHRPSCVQERARPARSRASQGPFCSAAKMPAASQACFAGAAALFLPAAPFRSKPPVNLLHRDPNAWLIAVLHGCDNRQVPEPGAPSLGPAEAARRRPGAGGHGDRNAPGRTHVPYPNGRLPVAARSLPPVSAPSGARPHERRARSNHARDPPFRTAQTLSLAHFARGPSWGPMAAERTSASMASYATFWRIPLGARIRIG